MTYGVDLRERVVSFVLSGGSKQAASRVFSVSMWCVHDWCSRGDLRPKVHGRRSRKLDWEALRAHVRDNKDSLLKERAAHFGVHIHAIWYALKEMKLTHKKNTSVSSAKP